MLDRPTGSSPKNMAKRPCCIIAELGLDEHDVVLDGVVRWLVVDRALFREATRYILKRKGDSVRLRILGVDYPAMISGTTSEGYELLFDNPLDPDVVDELVSQHLTDE
jgi:hypothetical protein